MLEEPVCPVSREDMSVAPQVNMKGKGGYRYSHYIYKLLSRVWFDQYVAMSRTMHIMHWLLVMGNNAAAARLIRAVCLCLITIAGVAGLFALHGSNVFAASSAALNPPWQQAEGTVRKLAVVIPFVNDDVPRLVEGIRYWASVGPACDLELRPRQQQRPTLFFFHSGTREAYEGADGMPEMAELISISTEVEQLVLPCFESVRTIFAELTPEEDGYPEGPSNMFFKLVQQLAPSLLQPFSHMYWMEWDVKPVRPAWLDALQFVTSGEEFWMKGGRYRGRAFDGVVLADPTAWNWVGHLNGNALYRLHSPPFNRFLELVAEREPPSHFWKPFDIAIWKTLYDLPYSWHLYQIYGEMFQTTGVIQHMGFTVQPHELQLLIAASPAVHLVHGDGKSAGTYKYERKFKAGVAQTNATVVWKDEVTASMEISVLCRTFAADLELAAMAFTSARTYFSGALEYVAVVPSEDVEKARAVLPEYVTVKSADEEQLQQELMQPKLTVLRADQYCKGRYIFHLHSADVFHRSALRRDFFIFNKPMVHFSRSTGTSAPDGRRPSLYQRGNSNALGQQVEFDFDVHNSARLFHRLVYKAAREHLERTHNHTVAQFLDTRQPFAVHEPQEDEGRLFHALSYLCAFLYYNQPGLVSWTYTGVDSEPEHAVPYEYAQIVPRLTCRGEPQIARLPRLEAEQSTQLQIMHKIIRGQTPPGAPCGELEGYTAWVMDAVRQSSTSVA